MPVVGVRVLGAINATQQDILSDDALDFVARLHRTFNGRRLQLLQLRQVFTYPR